MIGITWCIFRYIRFLNFWCESSKKPWKKIAQTYGIPLQDSSEIRCQFLWRRRGRAVPLRMVLIGEETLQYRDHVHNELRLAWTNRTNWVWCQMPSGGFNLPLWKRWKSVGIVIPNIWKKKHVPNHQSAIILNIIPGEAARLPDMDLV